MSIEDYYYKYVIIKDGCWDWNGNINTKGYAHLSNKRGHTMLAHRLSYSLHNADIPEGKLVLHKCNNPRCSNPEHLYLGTYSDNTKQAVKDGRHKPPKGEKHHNAKLTTAQVIAIRQDQRSQKEIAKSYGVWQSAVSKIKNYKMRKDEYID